MWYVYTLKDPITNEICYVGQTSQPKKRLQRHISPCYLTDYSDKTIWILSLFEENLKPVMEILDETEFDNEIDLLEKYWVSQFKTWGFNLLNMTEGGDGGGNFDHITPEHRRKAAENYPHRRVICQYDYKTCEKIAEFFSSHEAAKLTNLSRKQIVNSCKGRNFQVKGFYFRFIDDYFPPLYSNNQPRNLYIYDKDGQYFNTYSTFKYAIEAGYKLEEIYTALHKGIIYNDCYWSYEKRDIFKIKPIVERIKHEKIKKSKYIPVGRKTTIVDQYDLNGKFIQTFATINLAAKFLNCALGIIRASVKYNNRTAKGFVFRKHGEPFNFIQDKRTTQKAIPIDCYDINGNLIKSYKSLTEALKDKFQKQSVIKCCDKIIPNYKGFVFRYSGSSFDYVHTKYYTKSKKVFQYELDGTFIKMFNSLVEAMKIGFDKRGIIDVCEGRKESFKGFIFKYTK